MPRKTQKNHRSAIQNNSAQKMSNRRLFLLQNQFNIDYCNINILPKTNWTKFLISWTFAFPSSISNQYWLPPHQITLPKNSIEPKFLMSLIWIHIKIGFLIIWKCYWNFDYLKLPQWKSKSSLQQKNESKKKPQKSILYQILQKICKIHPTKDKNHEIHLVWKHAYANIFFDKLDCMYILMPRNKKWIPVDQITFFHQTTDTLIEKTEFIDNIQLTKTNFGWIKT